jgi:uncharacterized protein with ATP-grasp and redox domains
MRRLQLDRITIEEVYQEILGIPALQGVYDNITNEEIVETVFKKILKNVDSPDPFSDDKLKQNRMILDIYPRLKQSVNEALDSIYEAVKLAIIGNSIDFMVIRDGEDIEKLIMERMTCSLPEDTYRKFSEQLKSSDLLLYIGDNSGEIVFDKLLIETIKASQDLEVIFVVRSTPILNDATLKDAEYIRLAEVAKVIENGIDGPLPGTSIERSSEELKEKVDRADLIISKGGGNFDTLDEARKQIAMNITFMFLSKCYPYQEHFHVDLYDPIIANFFEKNG